MEDSLIPLKMVPVIVLTLFLYRCGLAEQSISHAVALTPAEEQWLRDNPVITFAPDPDFPPIEWIDSAGAFQGIAADYVRLLKQQLPVELRMVACSSWQKVLNRTREGEIDMLSAAAQSPHRDRYLLFSRPHISFPAVIICNRSASTRLSLDDLQGMRVSIVRGYVWEEYLRSDYPGIKIDVVDNVSTGLRKVSFGLSDAFIENLATTTFYLNRDGIGNLKVGGETGYVSSLCFAVRKDLPVLHSIINRVVESIPQSKRDEIRTRWVPSPQSVSRSSRSLLIALGVSTLVTVVILLIIMGWNRLLRRQVNIQTAQLKKELSERRGIEDSLRTSETKYRELVELANSIILRINAEGIITFFNEYAQNFFGYRAEEVIGKESIGLIVPQSESETGRDLTALIENVITSPERYTNNENENIRKDGSRVRVAWNNRPVYNQDGSLKEIVCVGTDMTERLRAQKLKRESEMKLAQADRLATLGTLVSGVAHEINNPTNYISLNNENLREMWRGIKAILDQLQQQQTDLQVAGLDYSEIREETDRLIDAVGQGTERIQSIVKGLKTFAGTGPVFEDASVNLNDVVCAAIDIVGPFVKKRSTRLRSALHRMPLMVRGSFQSIEQVVINLLTNAAQALTSDSDPITVSTGINKEKEMYYIAVEDGGRGMSSDVLTHIFDPFFTTGRDHGGTGLGLSVSYRIAQAHNGSLEFDSTPDVGTRAVFLVPPQNQLSSNSDTRE